MILDLGLADYSYALKLQHELVAKRRLNEISDSALIAEHPPVFTIGRSGSRKNLLVSEEFLSGRGIKVLDVDRGGDITFHSPGQMVIYPIIDLRDRARDLHKYLRDLEGLAINFLQSYGVKGRGIPDATGVWVGDKKISFIGVAAKDWITYHGLSINVNNDTRFFSMINPCGMKDLKVTSLKEIMGRAILMHEAKSIFLNEFKKIFTLKGAESINEYCTALA